jgi:release factor glutamine methyltransferase
VPTIHTRVNSARELLLRAGVPEDDAGLEARLLAQFVLGWDAVRFLADARKVDSPDFAARFDALVERRARREPLAYITGEQEFWNLSFELSSAVLIPRPETEGIIEAALKEFPGVAAPLRIADVCTGSGCLAVALARERDNATVIATDISAGALAIAKRNASRHGVQARVRFLETDLLRDAPGPFDLIVANPPYVPDGDRETMQPEVRDYEPALALFAGADGLTIVRRLLEQAPARLAPGGLLIFEFGFGEADAVQHLIATTPGLTMTRVDNDLQGIPRIAIAAAKGPGLSPKP